MQEKDKFLKKISYIFFITIFFVSENLAANNIKSELLIYNKELNNTSVSFIQSDGETIEEGIIFVGADRIKIDYKAPKKLTFVLSQKKGMYVNHALKEVQYFDTKKNIIKVFFKILTGNDFFESSDIQVLNKEILIEKYFEIDKNLYKTQIIYENNPLKLRKIKVLENNNILEVGFFNHNNLKVLKRNFFSLINPYLN